MPEPIRSRVSMIINAVPLDVGAAFIEPDKLTRYWLAASSGPLQIGRSIKWSFMVPGAEAQTTAKRLDPGRAVSWTWDDGTDVDVDIEDLGNATAVTIVTSGFSGTREEITEAALNVTEGFALVLADLKTLLETGSSAGIVRDKAKLIQLRNQV